MSRELCSNLGSGNKGGNWLMSMHGINLFPWRETLEKRRAKTLLFHMLASVIAAIVVLIIWFVIALSALNEQEARNAYISNKNKMLTTKVSHIGQLKKEKAELLRRIMLLNQLQINRAKELLMLVDLAKAMPDSVYLLSLDKKTDHILLHGRAENSKGISVLMRQLSESPFFTKAHLSNIRLIGDVGFGAEHEFKITLPIVKETAGEKV